MDNPASGTTQQLSKHRIEALVDGIFAVAMTLLVIELRLPEHLSGDAQLREVLVDLLPNFGSWVVSFVVLGVFWMANHRIYSHVRHVDTPLLWWTLMMLAGASLLPFASAVNGRVASQLAQAVYSGVMILTIAGALMVCRHVYRNPDLCAHPMDAGTYRATCARLAALIVIALLAVALAGMIPGSANFAFLLTFALGPLGRTVQRRSRRALA